MIGLEIPNNRPRTSHNTRHTQKMPRATHFCCPRGRGTTTFVPGHLPFLLDVLLLFSLEFHKPAALGRNSAVTISRTAASCTAQRQDCVSDVKWYQRANSHWRQCFQSVNELCVLSHLAQRALCSYCILQCFCNYQLASRSGGSNLHSLLICK